MKNFKASPEEVARISALFAELHDLCVDNGIPYLACCVTENDGSGMNRASSAFIDGRVGLAPDFLIAAAEMVKATSLPPGMIEALIAMNELDLEPMDEEEDECDCPACQLARGALEATPSLH